MEMHSTENLWLQKSLSQFDLLSEPAGVPHPDFQKDETIPWKVARWVLLFCLFSSSAFVVVVAVAFINNNSKQFSWIFPHFSRQFVFWFSIDSMISYPKRGENSLPSVEDIKCVFSVAKQKTNSLFRSDTETICSRRHVHLLKDGQVDGLLKRLQRSSRKICLTGLPRVLLDKLSARSSYLVVISKTFHILYEEVFFE